MQGLLNQISLLNLTAKKGLIMTVTFYPDLTGGSGGATVAVGTIAAWDTTKTYTTNLDMVSYQNAIWTTVATNTNSTPSLTNSNWKRVADMNSSNSQIPYINTTGNYTLSQGVFAVRSDTTTSNNTITLDLISNFVPPTSTTMLSEFLIIKQGFANILTIQTSGSDTFQDGSTSKVFQGNGVNIPLYLDFDSSVWRI